MNYKLLLMSLLLVAAGAQAEDAPAAVAKVAAAKPAAPKGEQGAKALSGISILGNQEAPKSLVIVPWKSSEIGDANALATLLDDSRQPVDKDVFLRELSYYQIRTASP